MVNPMKRASAIDGSRNASWLGVFMLFIVPSSARGALDDALPAQSPEIVTRRVGAYDFRVRTRAGVTEFADAAGKVFAVRWQGHHALSEVLGPYAAQLATAGRSRRGGHAHLSVRTRELSVDVFSHYRFITGSAWLPQHLPTGVSIDALR